MNRFLLLGSLATMAFISLSAPQQASAATATFSYTGLQLNTNGEGGSSIPAPFTGQGSISGSFTLDCTGIGSGDCAGLPSAEYGSRVTAYSFFLSDIGAPISLTAANRVSVPSFVLQTDANRNLTFWNIVMNTTGANCPANASVCAMRVRGSTGLILPPWDVANVLISNQLREIGSSGSGSFTTAPVPLPIPALMLLSGIASIIPFRRRPSLLTGRKPA